MRFCRTAFCSSIVLLTVLCGALLTGCSSNSVAAPTDPGLAFTTVPPQVYGNAPITVSAASSSAATITYGVTSGPATIAGTTVTLTGAGMVILSASQPASGSYAAGTASTSFMVSPEVPTKAITAAAFTVSATSASSGAMTYAVTSGPATVSGNTVTLTGLVGTVVLTATQAAAGNYAVGTGTTSFLVQAGVTTCPTTGVLFCGVVMASQTPVKGSTVQLYAAGATGSGSTPTALLTGALTTDVNGSFSVPSSLSCPTASTPVYLLAKGGQVGALGSTNSALWLIAPLPPCGSLGTSTSVVLNELSTVATAAALNHFYAAGGNIGASVTNAAGLAHAIATEESMVNLSTGISPSSNAPANVTIASAKLNTLANAFSACAVSSTQCTALFSAAATTTAPITTPGNTLDAAFNIARQPGNNVTTLFALSTGTTFTPALTNAPPDWMMYITVSGGGMSEPTALGIDGSGNVWSANYNEVLSEFSPNGTPVYASGITGYGLHESYGMAIDGTNNIWVANDETPGSPYNGGTVSKFSNAGVALSSGIGYTTGLYFPTAIASDPNTNMWVANYGNSTYALYSNSGSQITTNCNAKGCGYGELVFPVAVAADNSHVGWVANQSSNTVTRISADGSTLTPVTCCSGASGLAVDAQGYVWVANYFGDSISELSSTGTVISGGYTGSGIVHPQGIAVDGSGTVWIADYRGNAFSELAGSQAASPGAGLSPSTGFGSDAGMVEPYALAIDASGNVWISNQALNTLTEFVGVASPVKTPLVGQPQVP